MRAGSCRLGVWFVDTGPDDDPARAGSRKTSKNPLRFRLEHFNVLGLTYLLVRATLRVLARRVQGLRRARQPWGTIAG